MKKVLVIVGPTASGKSDLAVRLAKKFNGEIISADSRQVYRGLNIGTGKITKKEMRGVPHHLLDVTNPKKQFSAAKYKKLAEEIVRYIVSKNKLPIIVGGTGLYLKGLIEGLSNLENGLDQKLRAELLKLHKTLSSTVIYVTHDQIEALTMGNKIAILNHGEIQQIGTPGDIYNNPVNTFVAGFIGNPGMNFFKGLADKKAILGIRPEHLLINQEKDITFTASIDLIEMLGNEFLIYAKTCDQSFAVKTNDRLNLKRNDQIKVAIDLSKVLFFDESTGKRIPL